MDIEQVSSTLSGIIPDTKVHGAVTRGLWNIMLRHGGLDSLDLAMKSQFMMGYIQALEDAGTLTVEQTRQFMAFMADLQSTLSVGEFDAIEGSCRLN